jgi:glycosyltransferase involved in cell wall biosynthesis
MKVALVAPSSVRCSSSVERRVEALARGLAHAQVEVEVVKADPAIRSIRASERDGVVTVRFPAANHGLGLGAAPGLWEYVRQHAGCWDVVHLHAYRGPFSVATGGELSRRLIFTPHAPIQRLMRWPYAPIVGAIVDRAARIVALSRAEAELIRNIFPRAAQRVESMPMGVDTAAIEAARPLDHPAQVVVAGGRLERRLERAIAAMASLDRQFRLVILGDGSATRRLQRYAHDLRVSERVDFMGHTSASLHYRWLRTARVFVTLTNADASGSELLEALTAGAAVVASNVQAHREAAELTAGSGVRFVEPECSPLELADAIAEVAEAGLPADAGLKIPSPRSVATSMLGLYGSLNGVGVAQ